MNKECVCGANIQFNRSLCHECAEIYGTDPDEWPKWLRWQVNDIQKEHDSYRLHSELYLNEIESNGMGGYRAKREFALRGCRTKTHLYEEREKH